MQDLSEKINVVKLRQEWQRIRPQLGGVQYFDLSVVDAVADTPGLDIVSIHKSGQLDLDDGPNAELARKFANEVKVGSWAFFRASIDLIRHLAEEPEKSVAPWLKAIGYPLPESKPD